MRIATKALLLLFWSTGAFAASGSVTRWNIDRTTKVALEIVDDHPDAIRIDSAPARKLRYEGTYGSDELLPVEYFRAGALVVVVSYTGDADAQRVGGVTLHGERFDGESFAWSDGSTDTVELTSTGGAAAHGIGHPFCNAAPSFASLDEADCQVRFSDVYEPPEKWSVMFYASERATGYSSGADFTFARFDDKPDGNGISLAREKEPACVRERACVFFVGRLKYWRGKRSYFAVEIRLRNGRPDSAIAHDLETYGGRVTR